MSSASPTTYGLLGLLAVRSWTGYELTRQVRRSLRFVWSSSEGHLYREQKRLVERGWAKEEGPGLFTVTEPVAREMAGQDGVASRDALASSPGR